ncbi:tumor necrosis factor receptor superfamily member 1A [Discoglossus pictus]
MNVLDITIFIYLASPIFSDSSNVPVSAALLLHGEPAEFRVTAHRQKRAEPTESATCADDEYQPRNAKHCCKKCPIGKYKVSDCANPLEVTKCKSCDPGTFTAISNNARACQKCTRCKEPLRQVALSACTLYKDTVCGCPSGQFQSKAGNTFTCHNCSRCQNGTEIASTCSGYNDTLCNCYHGFFFDEKNRKCRSCDECDHNGCSSYCPQPVTTLDPTGQSPLLYGFVGFGIATVVLFGTFCVLWRYINKRLNRSPSESLPPETTGMLHTTTIDTTKVAPGYTRSDCDDVKADMQPPSSYLPLPDFITSEPRAQRMHSPLEFYCLIESVPLQRWKEFVRRLGLSDNDIDTSERDNRSYRDAQYNMLRVWEQKVGTTGATRDMASRVLRDMELGGCVERLQQSL